MEPLTIQNSIIDPTKLVPVHSENNSKTINMLSMPIYCKDSSPSDRFMKTWGNDKNKSAVAILVGVSGIGKTSTALEIARKSKRSLYLAGTGSISYFESLSTPLTTLHDGLFKRCGLDNNQLKNCQAQFEKEASRLIAMYFLTRCLVHLCILANNPSYSPDDWLHCQLSQSNHSLFDEIWNESQNLNLDFQTIKNSLIGYFKESDSNGWIIMDEANIMLRLMYNKFTHAGDSVVSFTTNKDLIDGRSLYHFVARCLPTTLGNYSHCMFLGTDYGMTNLDALYSNQARDPEEYPFCVFTEFDYLLPENIATYMSSFVRIDENVCESWRFKRACWLLQGRPRHAARWLKSALTYRGSESVLEILWKTFTSLWREFSRTMVEEWERVLRPFVLPETQLRLIGPSSSNEIGKTAYRCLESSIYNHGFVNATDVVSDTIISVLGARLMHIVKLADKGVGLMLAEPAGIDAGWKALSNLCENDPLLFVMEQEAQRIVGLPKTGSTRDSELDKLIALAILRLKGVTQETVHGAWPFSCPQPGLNDREAHCGDSFGCLPLILDGREHSLWPLKEYNCSKIIELFLNTPVISELRHDMNLNCVAVLTPTEYGPLVFSLYRALPVLVGSKSTWTSNDAYVSGSETHANLSTLRKHSGPAIRIQVEWPNSSSLEDSSISTKLNSLPNSAFISIHKESKDVVSFFGEKVVQILSSYDPPLSNVVAPAQI